MVDNWKFECAWFDYDACTSRGEDGGADEQDLGWEDGRWVFK